MTNNEIIKQKMHEVPYIPQWMLANKLGVHENTIQRSLRVPMSETKFEMYMAAIEEIKAHKKK